MSRICGRVGPREVAVVAFWIAVAAAALRSDQGDGLGLAYIGPGAGFAFLGSFLSLLSGIVLSAASLLALPFRMLWRLARRRQGFKKAQVRRVIFLGLDGLDPRLTDKYLAEGKLPHLAKLRDQGSYHRLRTTFPHCRPWPGPPSPPV
jgi:hypothetical protein